MAIWFIGCLSVPIVLLLLLAGGVRVWWYFDQEQGVSSYGQRMTPEELQAVKEYVAQQDALKAESEARRETEQEPEQEIVRLTIDQRINAAREKRRQEREKIRADFPFWFVDFAIKYNAYSYNDVASLANYVISILKYASKELEGRMPIRRCAEAADGGLIGELPNPSCSTRTFFERLSKILTASELLLEGSNRGSKGRKIAPDAIEKLRPASGVRRKAH